jgi:hypothetical protein
VDLIAYPAWAVNESRGRKSDDERKTPNNIALPKKPRIWRFKVFLERKRCVAQVLEISGKAS